MPWGREEGGVGIAPLGVGKKGGLAGLQPYCEGGVAGDLTSVVPAVDGEGKRLRWV